MTPEEQDIAEIDALVTRTVDAWIAEGFDAIPWNSGYGPRGRDVLRDMLARSRSEAWSRSAEDRFERRVLHILWGETAPFVASHCTLHPDCLRSADVARLCWIAAHPKGRVA